MEHDIQANQWEDDLIWCPSQCYYYYHDENGSLKCLYLRWRHRDPWTAEIIPVDECGEFGSCDEWENMNPPFFKDSELDALKEWCIEQLKIE